jgi:hypothetical protein
MNRFIPANTRLALAPALAFTLALGCSGAGVTSADSGVAPGHPGAPTSVTPGTPGTPTTPDPGTTTRAAHPGLCAPPTAFSYALCTCEDLTQVGWLKVGAGASGDGSVGVNGFSSVANDSEISGSWVSWRQWTAGTGAHIGGSLRSGADLLVAGAVWVGKDLAVKQNLTGAGFLNVGGALRVGGNDVFLGFSQIAGGKAAFDAPTQPPCGCDPASLFDVVGAVNQARTLNDNAARGVPAGAQLDIGVQRLALDTGRYFFQGVHNIGAGVLDIRGNVSIYIDGSLDEIGAEAIKIETGASLDLYVSGAVRLVGFSPLGDRQSPSSFRLFVGGSDRLSIGAGLQEFFGSIYAPTADLAFAGVTVIWGSLFAKQVIDLGVLAINHGGAVATCTPPAVTTDGGVPTPPPPNVPPTPPPPIVP